MAAIRKKPINPFLYSVLEAHGYVEFNGTVNMKAAARRFDIPYSIVWHAADITHSHHQLSSHLAAAKAFGIPFELWVKGLLGQLDTAEEAELARLMKKITLVKQAS